MRMGAERIDWTRVEQELDAHGCATIPQLIDAQCCLEMGGLWEERDRFRSEVIMARHGYGSGAYRYFDYPLPPVVAQLRSALYPPLATIANRWADRLGVATRYPDSHEEFHARCHSGGQIRPTPLILRYEADDWNALHQDLYGDHVFPLQVAILLSQPARISPAASSS